MRSRILTNESFLQGVVAGVACAGVAVLAFGAVKRAARLRAPRSDVTRAVTHDVTRAVEHPVIDGARPISRVDLDLQSPPETRSTSWRLESEGPDAALVNQRW